MALFFDNIVFTKLRIIVTQAYSLQSKNIKCVECEVRAIPTHVGGRH